LQALFIDARVRNMIGKKKGRTKHLAILDKTSNAACLRKTLKG